MKTMTSWACVIQGHMIPNYPNCHTRPFPFVHFH